METLEIEVHPNSKLSKNSLHRVRTEGQSREVDKITRDERADGMILGIEAMQIHGNWPLDPKVEIEVTQHYSNVSFDPDGLACVVAPYIDGAVSYEGRRPQGRDGLRLAVSEGADKGRE